MKRVGMVASRLSVELSRVDALSMFCFEQALLAVSRKFLSLIGICSSGDNLQQQNEQKL